MNPLIVLILFLTACSGAVWNNPYPSGDSGKNILYNAFAERPKHLDPVQSYSSNEILFTAQIYQPPLQYHYLKRPFTLIPQTVDKNANRAIFLTRTGIFCQLIMRALDVAYSVYELSLKQDIFYQPHPAFARNDQGEFLYHRSDTRGFAKSFQAC